MVAGSNYLAADVPQRDVGGPRSAAFLELPPNSVWPEPFRPIITDGLGRCGLDLS